MSNSPTSRVQNTSLKILGIWGSLWLLRDRDSPLFRAIPAEGEVVHAPGHSQTKAHMSSNNWLSYF